MIRFILPLSAVVTRFLDTNLVLLNIVLIPTYSIPCSPFVCDTVSYALSVESLDSALRCVNMKEGIEFVDKNLYRMTHLILGQSPDRLNHIEKTRINTSLQLVTDILLEMTPEHLFKHLNTVAELFWEEAVYYAGRSQLWSNYVGKSCPEEREKSL